MSLKETWIAFRNRCLTSPKFHEFALKFPLTRPVVRKRQSEVFDVVSGFVYSQVLTACVQLGLLQFTPLKEAGASLQEISAFCDLQEDETRRLIDAASSLRILQKNEERYFLGDLGAALSINEGALRMIGHHHHLYKDMIDPVKMLREGRRETNLSRYWDYARNSDPDTGSFRAYSITNQRRDWVEKQNANWIIFYHDRFPARSEQAGLMALSSYARDPRNETHPPSGAIAPCFVR